MSALATLPAYVETLGSALDLATTDLANRGAVLANPEGLTAPFAFGGVEYGTSKEAHAELLTLKGKPTKKWAHLTIWRSESGRYEWNLYIL